MKIDTTINLKKVNTEKIEELSQQVNLSKNYIVTQIVKIILSNKNFPKSTIKRVKYQRRDKKINWKKIHMYVDYDIYEKCIDMRKIEKKSVSYIINSGISKYIYEIKKRICNNITDDFHHNYLFIAKNHEHSKTISIFWGMPDIHLLKQLID